MLIEETQNFTKGVLQMKILEKTELTAHRMRCKRCNALLTLTPCDFEKLSGTVPPMVYYVCRNCGAENPVAPDEIEDKWFNEKLWEIIRGELSHYTEKKLGIFDTIRIFLSRKRFLRIFFRDKETEFEIIAGKESALRIDA